MPSFYPYEKMTVQQLRKHLKIAKMQHKEAIKMKNDVIADAWITHVILINSELEHRDNEVGKSRISEAVKGAREIFDSYFDEI